MKLNPFQRYEYFSHHRQEAWGATYQTLMSGRYLNNLRVIKNGRREGGGLGRVESRMHNPPSKGGRKWRL